MWVLQHRTQNLISVAIFSTWDALREKFIHSHSGHLRAIRALWKLERLQGKAGEKTKTIFVSLTVLMRSSLQVGWQSDPATDLSIGVPARPLQSLQFSLPMKVWKGFAVFHPTPWPTTCCKTDALMITTVNVPWTNQNILAWKWIWVKSLAE